MQGQADSCTKNKYNFSPLDVALGKPSLQSSLMPVDEFQSGSKVVVPGVGPELAVDGDMSNVPSAGSCSITDLEVDPWWRVDLQREHIVTDVNVVSSSGMFYRLGCHPGDTVPKPTPHL